MGTRPRTVRYFPKMKVRGYHRRIMVGWDHMMRSFDWLGVAAVKTGEAMKTMAKFLP